MATLDEINHGIIVAGQTGDVESAKALLAARDELTAAPPAAPDTLTITAKRGIGHESPLRTAAKTVGGILGGIGGGVLGAGETAATGGLGLPAGLATAMAGGTMGYSAAGNVFDLINGLFNHHNLNGDPSQPAWKSTLNDAAEGATGELGGPVIAKVAVPVISAAARLAPEVLGTLTRKGGDAFKQAASAGFAKGSGAGTDAATNFRAAQTGDVSPETVIPKLQDKLSAEYDARNANYQENIAPISKDARSVPFDPITQAIKDNQSTAYGLRGQVVDQEAADALKKVTAKVNQYAQKGWDTPGDLNDLKLSIGQIRSGYTPGSKAFRAADKIYDSVESAITDAAPDYANVMADYSGTSKALQDIRSGLSLNNKANTATQISKLLSAMKGAPGAGESRLNMLDRLVGPTDSEIKPTLAGAALSPWTSGGGSVATAEGLAALGGTLSGHGMPIPEMIGLAGITSPRLMGSATYGASLAAGNAAKLAETLKSMGINPSAEVAKLAARMAGSNLQGNSQ